MMRMIGSMIFAFSVMFAMAGASVAPVIVMATDAHAGEKPADKPLWMQVQEAERSLEKCVGALGQLDAQFGECSRGFEEVSASLETCEGNLHGQAAAVALMAAEIEGLRKEKKSLEAEADRLRKDLEKVQKKHGKRGLKR